MVSPHTNGAPLIMAPPILACSDALLERDFSHLRRSKVHYCDYNGCPPVSSHLLLDVCAKDVTTSSFMVLGNPHSSSSGSSSNSDASFSRATERLIEQSRERVLRHFSAPDFGEYRCVFVNGGATSAIQLVGDVFFSSSRDELSYAAENHTSVVGLRNVAWLRGGDVHVLVEEEKSTTGWTSVTLMNPGESTTTTTKTKTKWWFRRRRRRRRRNNRTSAAEKMVEKL